MIIWKRNISFFLMLSVLFLLNSCSNLVVLNPKGEIGIEEKSLIILSSSLMLIVVLPALIMTLAFAWHYRRSNRNAKYTPEWKSSKKIEIVIWTIPSVIIIILAVKVWVDSHRLDPYKPLESAVMPLTIQVVSLDWKWLFIYPEQHIASVNQLVFPTNTPLHFNLTSATVMNSFFIPQLGSQIMTMAGMQTQLNLIANMPGTYEGISANFSGQYFTTMRFKAVAVSPANFLTWVDHTKLKGEKFNFEAYNALSKSKIVSPKYFSEVPADIFMKIISLPE